MQTYSWNVEGFFFFDKFKQIYEYSQILRLLLYDYLSRNSENVNKFRCDAFF